MREQLQREAPLHLGAQVHVTGQRSLYGNDPLPLTAAERA